MRKQTTRKKATPKKPAGSRNAAKGRPRTKGAGEYRVSPGGETFNRLQAATARARTISKARAPIIAIVQDRKGLVKTVCRYGRICNPPDTEIAEAAAMSQAFHGRPARKVTQHTVAESYPATLTELGRLVDLTIENARGQVFSIGARSGVMLCATPDGSQLYFVGGDQGLPIDSDKDHEEIGKVLRIAYRTDKAESGHKKIDWEHEFAEHGGSLPTLAYDVANKKLYLIGGSYRVTERGIED